MGSMNLEHARQAAKALTDYWARHGVAVHAVVVDEFHAQNREFGSHRQFTIRTTPPMVNGFPQGISHASAKRLWLVAAPDHLAKRIKL